MHTRRSFILVAGAGVAASTAGCLNAVTGSGPVEFEASASVVDQATIAETGYEFAGHDEVVVEREFEAAGQTREVVVTNYLAEYEKTIDLGPLGEQQGAVFTSLTTPRVNVLGREFNPVANMSTAELAEMVQQQYERVESLEHLEDRDVVVNGTATVQSKFKAEASIGGGVVDLFLHVSEAVEMGEDLVVTVGGYPEITPGEEENVLRMMRGVGPDE
jgi:hypothetical protein